MPIVINYAKCCWENGKCKSCTCGSACVGCVEACPVDAISREKVVKIDLSKCIECGVCVESCKHQALELV